MICSIYFLRSNDQVRYFNIFIELIMQCFSLQMSSFISSVLINFITLVFKIDQLKNRSQIHNWHLQYQTLSIHHQIILQMKIFPISILIVLIIFTTALPNHAPYIREKGRPLNIAHRGLASVFPENTLQSFEAAMYQGADFIELDVVYTKQKQLLVMHDPYLTRITDIRSKKQFATRYDTRIYQGQSQTDWWTDRFTLNQLRTLTIKQDQGDGRLTIFDFQYTFPLLSEVIQMVIAFNKQHQGKRNPDGRLVGILIEAKDSQMYRNLYNIEIGQTVLQVLKRYGVHTIAGASAICPIYLHSFDYGTIKYWASNTQLPRNFLVQDSVVVDLEDINKYATGIGFQDDFLWNYDTNKPTALLQQTKALGLIVHIWTFKDDDLLFNAKDNIEMYRIAQLTLKIDGVITEFADIYAPLAQMFKDLLQDQISDQN